MYLLAARISPFILSLGIALVAAPINANLKLKNN